MKQKIFDLIIMVLFVGTSSVAQEIPQTAEQQLEQRQEEESGAEDDGFIQQLERYLKDPVDLNKADRDVLASLFVLNDLQIDNFLSYRNFLGTLLSIYELQSVPAWDIITIRKLLPYIKIGSGSTILNEINKNIKNGEYQVLFRLSQQIEKPGTENNFKGGPQRIFLRYRYQFKDLLRYGMTCDKDAGEQFFKGAQPTGFDFYSFHLFLKRPGVIKTIAIGDYSVNLGQGLVLWQGLAFKKGGDVVNIKRQGPVLKAYNSADEFYFQRGIGVTIAKQKIRATFFLSLRKLSANIEIDPVNGKYFSSFQTSGYHRTSAEIEDRNVIRQRSAGFNINYKFRHLSFGLNGVVYQFSLPLQKREEPYNLFAIAGDKWINGSIDFSYTFKNLHFFGEAAVDQKMNKAILSGLLFSADPKIDLAFLYRYIAPAYQALNGNAFTENSSVTNEKGFYAGLVIRPFNGVRLEAYADLFQSYWLKYLVDAPGNGSDYMVRLTYSPNRQLEISSGFRAENKQVNDNVENIGNNFLVTKTQRHWRVQVNYKLNSVLSLRNRIDLVRVESGETTVSGFSAFMDILYKPMMKSWSFIARVQHFDTDGYDSRIYAYENDVLYSYAVPSVSGHGFRYYINLNYDISKTISFWLRWSQTVYSNKEFTGEIKLQTRFTF